MGYQPQFTITPALLARVEQIAALRERILAATVQVPWIPALQKDTRTRNTHCSTAIEGNPLTLEQVVLNEMGPWVQAQGAGHVRPLLGVGGQFLDNPVGGALDEVRRGDQGIALGCRLGGHTHGYNLTR